jgi:hypothetical protein
MSKGFLISVVTLLVICGMVFIPAGRHLTPEDAFRRFIANPMPSSVTKLEGIADSGMTGGNAYLSFAINPVDLDRIIRERKSERVGKFSLPGRLASGPTLDLPSPEFYQKAEQGGFYLLKLSDDHTLARFDYFRPCHRNFGLSGGGTV